MGTKNLTCVKHDGEYKVAQYGRYDGYPAGQGFTILGFLKSEDFNREKFIAQLGKCRFGTKEERYERYKECNVMPGCCDDVTLLEKKYPELSDGTAAEVLQIIYNAKREVVLHNGLHYAEDSLFCEWCYVIDLDDNTLEVFKGCNTSPLKPGDRFYRKDFKPRNEYFPIRLIAVFSLDNLPSEKEFVKLGASEKEE